MQSLVENSRKYLIDSKFCKLHQYAAGARKIHALVNEHFQLVSVELSKVNLEGKKILADKVFCSEEIRNFISQEKAEVCIPAKTKAVVIHKKLSTRWHTLRQIVKLFSEFHYSRCRNDSNLGFANTP